MRHELKTHPGPFSDVWGGPKRFEIRRQDRPFAVGDELLLCEFDPTSGAYSGREILVHVAYIIGGGNWGLPPDVCVMGFKMGVCLPPSVSLRTPAEPSAS